MHRPLIPDFTFSATAHATTWACSEFKLGDCDLRSFNLIPLLRSDCDGIVATHIFGNPCDHEKLLELVDKDNLPLVYDAAHAHGATYKGNPIGDLGIASVFSLSPTKSITTCEGGIVVTQDSYLADRIRKLRNYGTLQDYDSLGGGLNARLSEVHALVGLNSLKTFRMRQKAKKLLVETYRSYFPEAMLQHTNPNGVHAWKDFSIKVPIEKRDKLRRGLEELGIENKAYFRPISSLSCYNGWLAPCPNAKLLSQTLVQLPLHDNLEVSDVRSIAESALSILKGDTQGRVGVSVQGVASTAHDGDSRTVVNGRLV